MYRYEDIKPELFTDYGQVQFLQTRDKVAELLKISGAVMIEKCLSGDSWRVLAAFDRMVQLGELKELTGSNVAAQHRVFVKP